MPESPDISPDGKEVAFSALRGAIGDIFIVNVETGQLRNVTNDQFGDYSPTCAPDGKSIIYLARVSGNDKLFRSTSTKQRQDAAHVRHPRRRRRAVHRRRHDRVPVDRARSESADRSGGRAQRQHLQHLDAQPEERRAEAVHRHADRRTSRPSCCATRRAPRRSRSSPTTRVSTASTRSTRDQPLHTVASADFGSPGPIIDFQPPLDAHPGQAEHPQEGHVREAVPRGTAAGERRRHQRRRSVRRHAGDLHRRARRQAVQHLRRVGLAVPDDVVLVHEPVAPVPVRAAGVLADAVLLRLRPRAALRAASTATSIATWRWRRRPRAARPASASTRSTATPGSSCPPAFSSSSQEYNEPGLQELADEYQQRAVRPDAVHQRHVHAASA